MKRGKFVDTKATKCALGKLYQDKNIGFNIVEGEINVKVMIFLGQET